MNDNNEQTREAHGRPATLGSVEAAGTSTEAGGGHDGDGARSGGDPFAEPPLAPLDSVIAEYEGRPEPESLLTSNLNRGYLNGLRRARGIVVAEVSALRKRVRELESELSEAEDELHDTAEALKAEHEMRLDQGRQAEQMQKRAVAFATERLRGELETALAWHDVATSRRKEAEAALGRMEAALRYTAGRARQYGAGAESAGDHEASEGFFEIAARLESAIAAEAPDGR